MIEKKEILRYKDGEKKKIVDEIIEEKCLRIFVNNRETVITGILPEKFDYFIYGFLFTSGFINEISEIKSFKISGNIVSVEIEKDIFQDFHLLGKNLNSGCGSSFINFKKRNAIKSNLKIHSEKILYLMGKFNKISDIFKRTGAVHTCGVSDGEEIIIFADDISRHNAFDKVIGECLSKNIGFEDKIILTTGRITSDVVIKGLRVKIPVIVSISAPTSYALKIADFYNITLIGFVRGKRFNIYTHNWRIL